MSGNNEKVYSKSRTAVTLVPKWQIDIVDNNIFGMAYANNAIVNRSKWSKALAGHKMM